MYKTSIQNKNIDPAILIRKTLVQIFRDTVSRFPSKKALIFQDASISYEELDTCSNAMAAKLQNLKISKGSLIGVYLPRGVELLISILGILKSGAAYIPFDYDTPFERVKAVLQDVDTPFCISNEMLENPIITIHPAKQTEQLVEHINYSVEDGNAYLIFTSGSTGKPKGIPIKHFQIAHLLQSENAILQIKEDDIVYQGISVSFDMWFEEVWISFLVGATICVADNITAKSFDRLAGFFNKHRITVLHAVPSLLAFLDNKIPTLRIINSGGEACTRNIVQKWAIPTVRFFNSYGPTETTVTASIVELHQDDSINIGYPLPNYSMAVVNEKLEPVSIGEQGQLVIAGIGISEGYINQPELSCKVFLEKPASLGDMFGERIYLTGDIGRMLENGSFEITGRKDDQVKIRGYRVELDEIAAKINTIDFVSAAVVVTKRLYEIDQLIAYIIPKDERYDEKLLRETLMKVLPAYMVPGYFVKVPTFNYSPSGKVDKKALPEISFAVTDEAGVNEMIKEFSDDSFALEVTAILSKSFPGQILHQQDDFFDDLGGHSMIAAVFVSEVRTLKGLENISILDIYQKRKLETIIDCWKENILDTVQVNETEILFNKVPLSRFLICWVAQTIALFFIYGLVGAQIFVPYLGYYIATNEVEGHFIPILTAILLFCIVTPIIILCTVLVKKIFIGEFKEGDYPLWGTYYFKWWLYNKVLDIIPADSISSTPLYPSFLKKIGLRTEPDAQISKVIFGCADLIRIGKNVTISANVILNNAHVENGMLRLSSIQINDNAYIGTSCIVNGGCQMKEGSELKDLSSLEAGKTIPENECWEGSPAVFCNSKIKTENPLTVSKARRIKYKFVFFAIIISFPILIVLPLVPSIIGLNLLDENADWYSFSYLISTPLFSVVYIVLFLLEVILLSKLLRNSIREGHYSVYSIVYIKKWFLDQLFSLALYVIKPIFATLYITPIYRSLGAKVGKNTEISNASNVTHHLLEIGAESFIADLAIIGESDIRNQELILKRTSIGNKSFIGNSALIPQGYHLGDNKLIGVLSVPPSPEKISNDIPSDWFGSPAIHLPKRDIRDIYPDYLTYKPSALRKIIRAIVEFVRILIPQSVIFCLSILFIAYTHDLLTEKKADTIFILFPLYYIGIVAIPAFLFTVLLKWLFIGKYKKAEYPMWTWQVWRTEAITSLYEALAVPFFLHYLQGTPFLPVMLRLLGVHIGDKVWMDTTDFTEFDMVTIGDHCALNSDSGPQTHLFEDRVMKIGTVEIGANTCIGAGSIILYNSKIEKNCSIAPLSLVMKGEHLPANTQWRGIPIQKK